jgi:ferredoxin-type protein NapH
MSAAIEPGVTTSAAGGGTAAAARRPVRHFTPPTRVGGWLHYLRFSIARRLLQLSVLLLFFGTAHFGWTMFGRPLLAGNLSASTLAGAVPLADPFAVLQMLVARHPLATEALVGAAVVLALYLLAGGRVFCGWVCPMNAVTDAAAWTRGKLGIGADLVHINPRTRYVLLAMALVLSAATGVAAFEWLSPVSMLPRELIYGLGLGATAAIGIFVFDAFVVKHGWCGHLCPLGAFWSIAGRAGQLRVAFDDASCSRCGDCVKVCPEPRVLNFPQAAARGMVAGGECTGCARCVAICPEHSLSFRPRVLIRRPAHDADQST